MKGRWHNKLPADIAVQAVGEVVIDVLKASLEGVASCRRLDAGHKQIDEPGQAAWMILRVIEQRIA